MLCLFTTNLLVKVGRVMVLGLTPILSNPADLHYFKMARKIKMLITKEDQEELWSLQKKLGMVGGQMPKFKDKIVDALFG